MTKGMIVIDTIGPRLDILAFTTADRVMDSMEQAAENIQNYAQNNAPWEDQTGDAREGLITSVYEDGGEIVLELAHSVEYGYWLEVIQDGRFAIILPTLEALGPQVIGEAGHNVLGIGSDF